MPVTESNSLRRRSGDMGPFILVVSQKKPVLAKKMFDVAKDGRLG